MKEVTKMKKFRLLGLILTLCMCFAIAMPALAVDIADNSNEQIPYRMEPSTVVLYDSDCKMFVINDGADAPKRMYSRTANPANESVAGIAEEEEIVAQILEESKNLSDIYMPHNDTVRPNTMVIYGTDGYINHIYPITEEYLKTYASRNYQTIDAVTELGANIEYGVMTLDDIYVDDSVYPPLKQGKRLAPNNYIIDDNNSIRITSSYVMGTGRLTTFNDPIGENGDSYPNKAGDCATRRNIDNAPFHQTIHVRNLDNNIEKYMRKNDNGDLDYAVLDIFKWDGILMGEKYSSTFTFENGRYYYEF